MEELEEWRTGFNNGIIIDGISKLLKAPQDEIISKVRSILKEIEDAKIEIAKLRESLATQCPMCGKKALTNRHGQFKFKPPENIPGGEMIIENANWEECGACGERIIGHELSKALYAKRRKRLATISI
jgi:ribosomal protein L32